MKKLCSIALSALAVAVGADAAQPALRGIAIDETLTGPAVLADASPSAAARLPMIVRLAIDPPAFRGDGARAMFDRLDARLALYGARNIPVIVSLGAFPAIEGDDAAWIETIHAIVERARGRVRAYQAGAFGDGNVPAVDRYAFLLKRTAVEIRSVDSDARILLGPVAATSADWLSHLYVDAGAAPYTDGVAIEPSNAGASIATVIAALEALVKTIDANDHGATILVRTATLDERGDAAARTLVDTAIGMMGSRISVVATTTSGASLKVALTSLARLSDLLSGDLVTLDGPSVALKFSSAGSDVTAGVPHTLLYSLSGANTYLIYGGAAGLASIDVEIDIASMRALMVRDPFSGETKAPTLIRARDANGPARLVLPLANHPLVLDFNYGEAPLISNAETAHAMLPPVGEIIARHQQLQAAQERTLASFVADMQMRVQVRPSPAEPDWNAVTENRVFADKSGLEWAQTSFRLNGVTWRTNPPPFPLLQPEKVNSLPLDLRLTEDYRYRLRGLEAVDGREAFVVDFEPAHESRSLYRGTVWIDRQTFARVRVRALQTPQSGVIAANEEDQHFSIAGKVDGHPIWLLDRLVSRQTVLFAGRNLPLERVLEYRNFELNPADFAEQRAAARTSDRLMYRDTDQGVRYFVKRGQTRAVSTQPTNSARAFAMGADIDPSFDYPLPIAGWNILNFNFLNRDMQLALLFGGVIAVGNIQRPHLFGDKVDGSIDFFGLALKANDAVFDSAGERRGERVQTIPAAAGATIGYQVTPFHKVTARYDFRYDAYFADPAKSSTFVTPSSTATNGIAAGYEFRRRGYSFTANAGAYQRVSWRPWGNGAFDSSTKSYRRYDAGVSKDFLFAMFHTIHLNASYFGGERLDRFSMYQFGMFDQTRMHGVPSAVRFSNLAMVRASYSFNLFDQYRLDLFFEEARGRNPLFDTAWHSVTGTGIGLTLRGPRNTIVRTDFGKSILPSFYRGAGSFVAQLMIFKPL